MPATGLKIFGTGTCLPWCSIQCSCWRVHGRLWCIFCLMMGQMFSIGERSGLQANQFSTQTLLQWSHAVVIAAVCGLALSCWNARRPEGSICLNIPFSIYSTFQNMQAAHTLCTCAPPHYQKCWLLNNADGTLEGLPPLYPGGHGVRDFQQECQVLSHLTIEHFSTLKPFFCPF